MKTFQAMADTYQRTLSSLYDAGEIKQLFLMAYSSVTGENAIQYLLNSRAELRLDLSDKFVGILEELKSGRPIQYIIGSADFYGMRFFVNEHTLIPRPETEELVDWIISEQGNRPSLSLLDVGTGSGCIALSLKNMLPQARIDAIDIHPDTIQAARQNAQRLDLSVNFIQADILEWDSFMQADQRYDLIVSNPPYITPAEQKDMHQNVLRYEPHQALFVEAHAPLLFYDVIAEMGKKHLSPGGQLYFEINQYFGSETCELLHKKGYTDVQLRQDLNQVNRMVKATFDKII